MNATILPIYPADSTLVPLAAFIQQLPGGKHIGDKWKWDDRRLVGVSTYCEIDENELIYIIMQAYPPRCVTDRRTGLTGEGKYLFCVPETVAQIMKFFPLMGENDVSICLISPDDVAKLTSNPGDLVNIYAALWSSAPHSFYGLASAHDDLKSSVEAIVPEDLMHQAQYFLEVATQLYLDDGGDFSDALEKSLLVLEH